MQPSKSDWSCEYEHISLEQIPGHIAYLQPYIDAIMRHSVDTERGTYIEIGIGTGAVSILLKEKMPTARIVAIDNSVGVIDRFKNYFNEKSVGVEVHECDAFEINGIVDENATVIHHQGLLEHFSLPQIHTLLQLQMSMARRVVFSVPVKGYIGDDVGDEMRLGSEVWKDLLSREYTLYESGEFGIDINKTQGYFVISK